MDSSPWTLARNIYHCCLRTRAPRFYALGQQTNGMLDPMIYN